MAASIDGKMSVSGVAEFKRNMNEAASSVKNLDAQLKLSEKQFKQTGDAEKYLQDKSKLLKKQMEEQNKVIQQANEALNNMKERKVPETSKAFQDMQRRVYEAQAKLINMQMALKDTENGFTEAAGSADKLTSSVNGINKKISLDQVIGGIGKITDSLETAGKKAAELGKAIWENITDAARWGDDTATQAMILNMDVEEYQKYKKVFDTVAELTVQEWQKAKMKVQKAIYDPTDDQTTILSLLGISTHERRMGKYGWVQGAARDYEEVFWEIGKTLRERVASGKITQDLADTYANALFGKSFANLNPIFALGREGFQAEVDKQNVNTQEAINKLAEFNDQLVKLQGDFGTLKQEVLAGLAPALTEATKTLDSLLGRLIEYLQTEEGKQALQDMGEAVEGLFSDLSKIDPEQVVEGFAGVFDKIVGGLQWLKDNKGLVIGAMKEIVTGWGVLKLTGGAMNILRLIDGIKWLKGGGASIGAASGGTEQAAAGGAGESSSAWFGNLFDNLVSGMATKSVLDITDKLNDSFSDIDTSGGMTEQAVVDWVDKQIANGFIRAKDREKAISDNVFLLNLDEKALNDTFGSASGHDFTVDDEPIIMIDPVLPEDTTERVQAIVEDMDWPIETLEPTLPENAAEILQEQANQITLTVGVNPHLNPGSWGGGAGGGGGGRYSTLMTHANGIWSVPFDGYAALLHKGERVVPAREVASRSFSSNMYIESMYMNNGQDADGLAARVAAENERIMSGFGN